MHSSNKVFARVFFFLIGGVFILHFCMTVLHNTPEKYITARMDSYSHLWCYPVFHQGWALFAPEPQNKHKRMEMRYAIEGVWTDWVRAERICMDEHVKYRVTHYSKLCHVTQNIVYHLWLDVDIFNNQSKSAENYYDRSMGYGIASEFAKNQAYHFLPDQPFDSLQIKLILEDPFEVESAEVIGFPTYHIDDE